MHINLTPEQEKIVKEELESGRFRTMEEVVGEALRALHFARKSNLPARACRMAHSAKPCAKCLLLPRKTARAWKAYRSRS